MASTPVAKKIADRYTISSRLGSGGMGTVWRAEDGVLRREVAVKEVSFPSSLSDDERESLRARALREARAAAGLTHPGVVTVYDAIEQDEHVYIVMELVDAPTLQDIVDRNGPIAPDRAAEIGLELLDVLEAAHAAGIVHRDIKPANVMVPDDGRVKLADFGIAAVTDDPKITGTGMVMGSPKFMAPEQATGEKVTPATDLWSLGATLYFVVEGVGPFDRGQSMATLTAIVHDEPRATTRAGVLRPALAALLQKDPDARMKPPALRALLRDSSGAGSTPTATAVAADLVTPTEIAPAEPAPTERPPRRRPPAAAAERSTRRGLMWTAALVLLLIAVVAAAALLNSRDGAGEGEREQPRNAAPADPENEAPPEEDTAEEPSGTVPADWQRFTYDDPGFSISHPPEWGIEEGSCDADCIDFSDPATGSYLRLDWQSPPGDDAVAAWQAQSESFGDAHEDYEEIGIEQVSFKGSDNAALWEYTYSEGGAALHAYNLGVAFEDYGFALNFQTHEENWDAQQGLWEAFQESFEPPA
jgi:eukaryotic-like serine/threonine-protein kinase